MRRLSLMTVAMVVLSQTACQSWRVEAPARSVVRPPVSQVEESSISIPLSVDAEAVRSLLESDLKQEPLCSATSPDLNMRLLVNEKTFIEEPSQIVEVPYKAAECLVKKVPRQVIRKVKVGVEGYICWFTPWRWGRCVRDVFKDVAEIVMDDVRVCTPEQLEVVKTVFTPVVKLKESVAPTTARVRFRADLVDLSWSVRGNRITASPRTRITTSLDIDQGFLGANLSVRGALQCEAVVTPTINAQFALAQQGDMVRPTVTVEGIELELDKLCIPGAAEALDVVAVMSPLAGLIKDRVGRELEKKLGEVANSEAAAAADKINLTRQLRELAEGVRQPKMISPDVWFLPNAAGLQLSQLEGVQDGGKTFFRITARLVSRPELHLGHVPPSSNDPLTVTLGASGDQFTLVPRGVVPVKELASRLDSLLRAEVRNQKPKYRKVKSSVDVYQSGERVVFAVSLSDVGPFNTSGTLYLTGVPTFDAASRTLRFHDVSFDLATRAFLLKTAAWVLDGRIEKTLQNKLQFALGAPLDDALAKVANFAVVTEAGVLSGTVSNIDFGQVWIDREQLNFTLRVTGRSTFAASMK